MAINKIMRAALKALSYPDLNIKKNYKLERTFVNVRGHHWTRPFYKTLDHKIRLQDHQIPIRIFFPTGKRREIVLADKKNSITYPVLLFFHGGGWVTGTIDSYNKVCANMAAITRHIVVSVDYRLAPEYKFPAGFEDCYHVTKKLFTHSKLLHVNPQDITVIGDSAGGNLAAAVSLRARDEGIFLPARQILIYPVTHNDHSASSPFPSIRENGTDYLLTSKRVRDYMELYESCRENRFNPYFAPLIAPDVKRQPRTLLITAEFDPLRDEGEAYGERLRQAGNEVEIHRIPDALHGFLSLSPKFPQVRESYRIINRFLKQSRQER